MKKILVIAATILTIATTLFTAQASPTLPCGPSHESVLYRSLVFSGPDSVSGFYRIPALAIAPDGSIVAVADRRLDSTKDLPGRIDIVARRSTDGGKSWGDAIEIAVNDEGGGYGDPGVGVNSKGEIVVVMTHGNGLWESTPDNHATLYAARSADNGLTWTAPYEITNGIFASDGSQPVKCVSAFASSGRIETLDNGNMMFVLVARPDEKKWGPLTVYAVESSDGGKTWKANPKAVDTAGDESKIVQLRDRSLLMSIRNRNRDFRKFARSTDRGQTWSEPVVSSTLPDPACNGDVVTYNLNGREFLLHSIPAAPGQRREVSIFASDDKGNSWKRLITVCPTGSSYSALTVLPDGKLACLSEEESSKGGLRLWFNCIDVKTLLTDAFLD